MVILVLTQTGDTMFDVVMFEDEGVGAVVCMHVQQEVLEVAGADV